MENEDFDKEVNNLIEWCEDLDFNKYTENWYGLATSAHANVPGDDNAVQVLDAGFGEMTLGLSQNG